MTRKAAAARVRVVFAPPPPGDFSTPWRGLTGGGGEKQGEGKGVETSAKARLELGRVRGARRRVAMSVGDRLKRSFPRGVFRILRGGGGRNQGEGGRPL
jgi:hypothetical protein